MVNSSLAHFKAPAFRFMRGPSDSAQRSPLPLLRSLALGGVGQLVQWGGGWGEKAKQQRPGLCDFPAHCSPWAEAGDGPDSGLYIRLAHSSSGSTDKSY